MTDTGGITLKIEVRVHGHVQSLLPGGRSEYEFEISEPMNVSDFVEEHLEINPMVFASIVVDGKTVGRDYVVDDDAKILLVSPTAGG